MPLCLDVTRCAEGSASQAGAERRLLHADIALAYDFRPARGFGPDELAEALGRHRLVVRAFAHQALLEVRLHGNAPDIGEDTGDQVLRQRGRTEESVPACHLETGDAGFRERREL